MVVRAKPLALGNCDWEQLVTEGKAKSKSFISCENSEVVIGDIDTTLKRPPSVYKFDYAARDGTTQEQMFNDVMPEHI
jgi:hypothetical protein